MRHSTKQFVSAAALCVFSSWAAAQHAPTPTEWPLGMVIAQQGDAALLEIREAMVQGLPQSIDQLMAESLPAEMAASGAGGDTVRASVLAVPPMTVTQ